MEETGGININIYDAGSFSGAAEDSNGKSFAALANQENIKGQYSILMAALLLLKTSRIFH